MPTLEELDIQNLRPRLHVIEGRKSRAKRNGAVTHLTLHYNGPAVKGAGTPEKEVRQIVEVDVPHQQKSLGADSLMYHYAVLADGSIHQTRDLQLIAWHTRNKTGNQHSLGIHLPLGGTQHPTKRQWDATVALFEALMTMYGLESRTTVRGHKEWAETECPGPALMPRLIGWRGTAGVPSPVMRIYRVRNDTSAAMVRTGPGRQYPAALNGQARMWPGDRLVADRIDTGEAIQREARWVHRADGLGWVHMSLLKPD